MFLCYYSRDLQYYKGQIQKLFHTVPALECFSPLAWSSWWSYYELNKHCCFDNRRTGTFRLILCHLHYRTFLITFRNWLLICFCNLNLCTAKLYQTFPCLYWGRHHKSLDQAWSSSYQTPKPCTLCSSSKPKNSYEQSCDMFQFYSFLL